MIGIDDERLFVKFAAALQDGSSTQGAFGVFPHDLRRRVSIDGAVEDARLPVDPVLVVGLHYEARRHWRKSKQESLRRPKHFFIVYTLGYSPFYRTLSQVPHSYKPSMVL